MLPETMHVKAVEGATHILITHAHKDHSVDALQLAYRLGVPILGQYDLMGYWSSTQDIETIGFNKGGIVVLNEVGVTMVHAVHSSSLSTPDGPRFAGTECGFMISGAGYTIYFSSDADVMADMKVFNYLHAPDIGILCAGGHFTMDMKRAAYAAKIFFDFKTVIPCHYRTMPLLEQSADVLATALLNVDVIEPQVMVPIVFA
jgi:L-ascorbate metabolism protein UlaG (beta-lactamase superfamily)